MQEVICKKCGKLFIPAPEHVFKDDYRFYCSWTCYNHRNDGKGKGKRKRKRVELWNESMELVLSVFKDAEDAAEVTGFEVKKIRDACHNGTAYQGFIWKYKE